MTEKEQKDIQILIVDDEESLRNTFRIFLTREGYRTIVTASTFEEAVHEINQRSFDLIISDIVLEGASGIDFLKRIRELGINCPVIMITGYPNIETASEAVRLGAFDYIPKPVEKETLLNTTRFALKQRLLEQEKRKAEQEREQYRTFLDTIFRSVADTILTVDRDLIISKMNQAARSLFRELNPDFQEGSDLKSLCSDKNMKLIQTDIENVLLTGRDITENRIECERIDGDAKILSISISPLDNGRGDLNGAVLVIRDMTHKEENTQNRRTVFHRLIGASDVMQNVYTMIQNVGRVDATALITGESGTGKELAAEALHLESHRAQRPLVKVDCTAIPENLLESELFGHKKGSFTGADQDRMGRILQADGGTLFLDEIGDISTMMQLRLLRFLQEKTFYPVGRDRPIQVDVRVIAATNVDMKKIVQIGTFREDLYFRLRVIEIMLPTLREREGDIELLVNHFLQRSSSKMNQSVNGISNQAMELLTRYNWPGNVRELEHIIERACVLCSGSSISRDDLPQEIINYEPSVGQAPIIDSDPVFSEQHQSFGVPFPPENSMENRIIKAMLKTGGNKAKAARLLGIDRSTLYRKIRELRIDLSKYDL